MRLLLALAVVLGTLTSSRAHAQEKRDFSVVRFRPAVGPGNYLALDGAQIGPPGQLSYALAFDYADKPLAVEHPCSALAFVAQCTSHDHPFLQRTGLAHALLSVALKGHTQLSLDVPLGFSDGQPLFYTVNNAGSDSQYREYRLRDGFVLADVRLAAKTRVYASQDERLRVAVAAFSTAPTGMITNGKNCRDTDQCTFMGEHGVQAGGYGIVEYAPVARFRMAANVGAAYRPSRNLLGAQVGSELLFGAAAAYEPIRYLSLKAELAGALELAGADDVPLEARGGVSYGRDLIVTAGGGAGVLGQVGSPTYRVFAGLQWTPVFRDADGDGLEDDVDPCPKQAEDRDGFEDQDGCPDPDNDGDHIPDARDQCDQAAEDFDGFADDDGCPDPDNDGDGVPDGYDSCEGEKEDIDGDHDDDGCPDVDRDRDGVPDTADACPNEAEDTDALGDQDGCPEADYDGDGVLDIEDACPEQPESKNGRADDDGCPD